MTEHDFVIENPGQAKIDSPILVSNIDGDGYAGYVNEELMLL